MKKTFFIIFLILCGIVLIAKISNWFLNYSDETNQIINTVMYSLIGIEYIAAGFIWKGNLYKAIFIACGLYLIVMNFFDKNTILEIIEIICILTPILIIRFSRDETDKKELIEN